MMKSMKVLLSLLLALSMVLCLCACGSTEDSYGSEDETTESSGTDVSTGESGDSKDDGNMTYTVKVVDQDSKPISGAMVQLCLDTCVPSVTDASGVATYTLPEADYKVSFLSMPAGYELASDVSEFHFEVGSYEMTITLKAIA